MIIVWGGMLLVLWFFMIRPQRKKQKETQMMQNSLQVGDHVMTTAGMYGKVADLVNDIVVVEFGKNKSVLIPIHKTAIAGVSEPDMTLHKEEEADDKKAKDKKTKKEEETVTKEA
ncbi:preprotein translocase subunit YajC [Clostridiales bacterium COT073_COT-073]|nr:preprotein translocase subunit YajC [Clostridiales bacterium COT073_COT-073]